jgi:hypothetical protein
MVSGLLAPLALIVTMLVAGAAAIWRRFAVLAWRRPSHARSVTDGRASAQPGACGSECFLTVVNAVSFDVLIVGAERAGAAAALAALATSGRSRHDSSHDTSA